MIIVNAKEFGLIPNTEDLQHNAIQQAIDYCFAPGGGEVIISKGEYHLGDIRLRSHITLRLESGVHLMGSRNPEDYFNHRTDKVVRSCRHISNASNSNCPHHFLRPSFLAL